MPAQLTFGHYPVQRELRAGDISIAPLPTLGACIETIANSDCVHDDWFYAPRQERENWLTHEVVELPYSARVFGLEHTHVLRHAGATPRDRGRLEFLVDCLGFFVGMRLSHTKAGFLDATAIKPGTTNDIVWLGDSLGKALLAADAFWLRHAGNGKEAIVAALGAAIWSFQLAQSPLLLDFEQFIYLYTAIDAIYFARRGWKEEQLRKQQKLRKVQQSLLAPPGATAGAKRSSKKQRKPPTHAERLQALCRAFGMQLPTFARRRSRVSIVAIRNSTLHEGLFPDLPLGFGTIEGYLQKKLSRVSKARRRRPMNEAESILMGMSHLVSRFVIALFGMRTDYINTSVYSRERHGLRL